MPTLLVVGSQWGDEGKGKIIDLLSAGARLVIRAQGGNNAGHTILIDNAEYKLHLTPSGILHPHPQCLIGAGTVIDPAVLLQEWDLLASKGISVKDRIWISPAAHVIMPYHKVIDSLQEAMKGTAAIGTTGRGIGPCYSDKTERIGIRIGDLVDDNVFASRLKELLDSKNRQLKLLWNSEPLAYKDIYALYKALADRIRPHVRECDALIQHCLKENDLILLEGAQGAFLDLTAGTYPFVTSSHTTAAGIASGARIGPRWIDHTIGVMKAYTTRVGHGPFPTESSDVADAETSREMGTTTGRKRRIGWFDGVLARTSTQLNGFHSLAITKLDILDPLKTLKVCVAYEINGKRCDLFPEYIHPHDTITPIYETLPGWGTSTKEARTFEQLPENARRYIARIEQLAEVPVGIISVGPDRKESILHNFPALNAKEALR